MKLWQGRFAAPMAQDADDFNQSLPFDKKLYRADVTASIAHATMLGKCGILTAEESEKIVTGLNAVLSDIESGALAMEQAEDIHSFVEGELVKRIGDAGKNCIPRVRATIKWRPTCAFTYAKAATRRLTFLKR